MKCPIYEFLFLFTCKMKMFIKNILCLWNVLSMKSSTYKMSYLRNVFRWNDPTPKLVQIVHWPNIQSLCSSALHYLFRNICFHMYNLSIHLQYWEAFNKSIKMYPCYIHLFLFVSIYIFLSKRARAIQLLLTYVILPPICQILPY